MATRDETKSWVRAVLTHHRMKPTQLARKIGRVPSTLNRFLNDPEAGHDLSEETVEAIAQFAKVRPYEMPAAPGRRSAPVREAEASAFDGEITSGDTNLDDVVRSAIRMRNGIDPWLLRSGALTTVGYLPGDIMIVDLNERPRPHDVVCAQVYDWPSGGAQTVFRIYEPPYLLASTNDPALLRPLVVDDDMVVIKGVVTSSFRPRRTSGLAA